MRNAYHWIRNGAQRRFWYIAAVWRVASWWMMMALACAKGQAQTGSESAAPAQATTESPAATEADTRPHASIDLSDSWTPFVLRESSYRDTFIGLASNRIDVDIDDLTSGKDNSLELFGIPPTLTVLRKRFFDEIDRPCFAETDVQAITKLDHDLVYTGARAAPRKPADRDALKAIQARLTCERLFPGKGRYHEGVYDWATHIAIARFERKHMVYGWGFLTEDTRRALASSPLDLHYAALIRVLRERAVDAFGVIEDGTVSERTNLVEAVTQATAQALAVESSENLRAFWDGHADFSNATLDVTGPKLPEYYAGDSWDLQVVIDRGDVWYELPFQEDGTEKPQPRERTPRLSLMVQYQGKKIPLTRWRTTIGSWRSEWKDGQEYWKYKNSDVGARVWRHIIGAPVWIPPDVTPPRDLVKKKKIDKKLQVVPNEEELGPGFASAYGLVMAPHVVEHTRPNGTISTWDNQIRTHGSVDYTSILRRYSHGCHRLHNHVALRLFAFVLKHRPYKRLGQQPLNWTRKFDWVDEHDQPKTFEIRLRTRGYWFELIDPLPVFVTEGRIKGAVPNPITDYIPKPSATWPVSAAPLLAPEAP